MLRARIKPLNNRSLSTLYSRKPTQSPSTARKSLLAVSFSHIIWRNPIMFSSSPQSSPDSQPVQAFFTEFYKTSDTPDAHEKYADAFTEDATFILASKTAKGRAGIHLSFFCTRSFRNHVIHMHRLLVIRNPSRLNRYLITNFFLTPSPFVRGSQKSSPSAKQCGNTLPVDRTSQLSSSYWVPVRLQTR